MKLFKATEIQQIMPSNYEFQRKLSNTIFYLNSEIKYAALNDRNEIWFYVDLDVATRIKELLLENEYQFYYTSGDMKQLKIWIRW